MTEWFNTILSRFHALEYREKVALIILLVFFLALLLYFALWSPVRGYYHDSLAERDRHFSLIQYMRASEKQARSSSSTSARKPIGQSMITEVSNAAQQVGIKPNRLQPEGTDGVSVWFDNVVFDDLVAWIVRLNDQQGIKVRQISIDRQDSPGTVSARIVLKG